MNNINYELNKNRKSRPSMEIKGLGIRMGGMGEIDKSQASKISNSNNDNDKNKENILLTKVIVKKKDKDKDKENDKEIDKENIEEIKENKILKSLNESINENINIRKDARGYPIRKGNKKYKVTFKDLISKENLVNYIDIEDYKKYNMTNNSHISDIDNDNTSCTCIII